jgi:hypothetical protein
LKIRNLLCLALLCMIVVGCAEIEVPQMENLLKDPLGEGSLKRGMTKSEVITIYRDPDMKRTVVSNDWSETREEWFYKANYSVLPVGAGYLTEDLYLYFDDVNLTNISRTPLGKSVTVKKDTPSAYVK